MKAQLPRYQRLIPRPGQAHVAASPVAAVGGIMPPQQGMPQQQPGMRHPMHGREILLVLSFCCCCFYFQKTVTSSTSSHCSFCAISRSVWCSSSGHAKLHAWRDASVRSGSSYGATLPGGHSHGHEAARHVSSWTLLKQQSSHHIRFEVNTFLSSLCFFKPSCKQRAFRPVVVKTNIVC